MIVMLCALVAQVLAIGLLANPTNIAASKPGLFAKGNIDHDAFSTWKLMNVRAQPENTKPLIAMVGASVELSSYGTETEIERAFERRYGVDVDVRNFSTDRQSLVEHYGVIEALPRTRPIIAIVGIGPARFTSDIERLREVVEGRRIGLSMPRVVDEGLTYGIEPPPSTGVYCIDNLNYLAARYPYVLANLLRQPPVQDESEYLNKKRPPDEFRKHNAMLAERFEDYDRHFDMNLKVLEDMQADLATAPNLRTVFVEHPVNPIFVRNFWGEANYQDHLARMRAWQQQSGATYWQIYLERDIGPDAYFDWAHIRTQQARDVLLDELLVRLGGVALEMGIINNVAI